MATEERNPNEQHPEVPDLLGPIGLSRRQFAKKVGGGSAAALGLMWAAPKISTIRYAAKATAGSGPPTSSTTSTTTPVGEQGTITVDDPNPCAGTAIHIHASGFAPNTAVNLELDSPANPLGTTTANSDGRINVRYKVPLSGPFGSHTVIARGVKPGGQTLVLSAPIVIKTVADCDQGHQGSTVPTTTGASTSVPATSTPTTASKKVHGQGETLQKGSNLPFTGRNSTELALAGGAAALAGLAVYGIAAGGDDEDAADPDDIG